MWKDFIDFLNNVSPGSLEPVLIHIVQYGLVYSRHKMKLLIGPVSIVAALLSFFVDSISSSCLPCQPSTMRYTAWDTYSAGGSTSLTLTPFPRTVYNPNITNPTSSTVWTVGSQVIVTWNADDIPDEENVHGTLLLGYMTDGSDNEHLDIHHKLASNFNLKDGYVMLSCPNVEARSDYIVVLLGDSGNHSEKFRIQH